MCIFLNMHLAYLHNFFTWTWVINHNKYDEIKQFSKVDIKQNNISTIILFIKFLIYQWDPRHLQGSRVVYIFVYIMKSEFYLISNHIFVCINHKDRFKSVNKGCAQILIEFTDENSNRKYKLRTGLFIPWINQRGRISFGIPFTDR